MAEHARPHLSIGEVLSLLQTEFPDITISKIRFLESQGLLDPERTPSGYRKFYDDDLARLRWILTQQRDHFLPLKVIKERLAGAEPGTLPADEDGGEVEEVAATPATAHGDTSSGTAAGDRAALAEALARRAAQRGEQNAGDAATAPVPPAPVPERGPTDASFTTAELATAAGISERDVEHLASFGLIEGRTIGREVIFDGGALVVCRLAAGFLERGLEPRHLRMFKVAAEREAGIYEQLIAPLARQRNPEARAGAEARLGELADLGHQLRVVMLRRAVRDLTTR